MRNYFRGDGTPVRGDDFFGRKTLLKLVQNLNSSGKSILLIGERRIGKSSLLREFEYRNRELLATESPARVPKPVFISASGITSGSPSWFVQEISTQLTFWSEGQPQKISRIIKKSLKPEAKLPDLIRCLKRIREEDLQITLLFDEVDSALVDGSPQTASVVRAVAMEGHITILATSFLHPTQLEIESLFGSAWYNFFHFAYIGLFDDEETRELLTVLSDKSGRRFTDSECAFISDVFGNFPYYLQLAGYYIFQDGEFVNCSSGERANVLTKSLAYTNQQLEIVWSHSIRWLPSALLTPLIKIARDKTVADKKQLEILVNRGLVVERDGKYHIYSRTFKEFLKQFPEQSFIDKAKDSKVADVLATLGQTAFDTALKKAIEIAAQTYLGKP